MSAAFAPQLTSAEQVNLARVFRSEMLTHEKLSQDPCPYQIYVPPEEPSNEKPLLVWFHGFGERGNEPRKSLRWMQYIFQQFEDGPPLYILVVQHPDDREWLNPNGSRPDFIDFTFEVVTEVTSKYPIDRDRIYVSGVSSGGNATWEIVRRHPSLFAAASPMAATNCGKEQDFESQTPIWAFYASNDVESGVMENRRMVAIVKEAGGEAHLTETAPYPTWAHNCWHDAFEKHKVMQWLLAQRKDRLFAYWPPGGEPFPIIPGLLGSIAIIVVIAAIKSELARKATADVGVASTEAPPQL